MHPLLAGQPGEKRLLLGNEAIVRGALEAGVAVATQYPGTPSSEIGDRFYQISRETDLYFEYATNEKVALEVAAGAAAAGLRVLCAMKHVGVNVAADTLVTLAYSGVKGGLVLVSADDPSLFSSQNEQDNRYYAKLSGLPMLEPASAQEAKEMTSYALTLSEELGLPVILRTTTRINHSRGVVVLGELKPRVRQGHFVKNPFRYVMVPAVARQAHAILVQQQAKAAAVAESCGLNTVQGSGPWGIVSSGVSAAYVADAIADLGIAERVSFLKLGFSHPLPVGLIRDFLRRVEKVLVVEELEPYLEEGVRAIAADLEQPPPIRGKGPGLFSRLYEYHPGLVRQVMATFFGVPYEPPTPLDPVALLGRPLPERPPNLCPGCSHRATYYAVKIALRDLGVAGIFPTDIGCYTLGLLPPLSMADYLLCMGSSVSTAAGIATATDQKVIAFIGDSTFFHSGIPGLINAVHNRHNLLLIILDNGTTAMTGHQPHPGVTPPPPGYGGQSVDIYQVVQALGVDQVQLVNPLQYRLTLAAVKEAVAASGVRVIISRSPCILYLQRLGQKKRAKTFVVGPECRDCRHCLDYFGCPALHPPLEGDGPLVIDATLCNACGFCLQLCEKKAIRAKSSKGV
ncbi:MAG: indolepyruvate ferredoxin oxidoreductase subunit alpha [Desulfobacca sp.]|uniref:indolepyruvate ferredoxin oxidoreductase subunit alpha n=1 Tax=Desulfobacca sp. TaxID=2067990 RepID=UPI00404B4112